MYHGICPFLLSTGDGFGSCRLSNPSPVDWPVEAFHAVCSLTSLISVPFGLYEASFFGTMEYSQLTVWIFMNSHTGFDIMITMAICWYLKTSVFIAYSVVFPYYAVFVHTYDVGQISSKWHKD